MEGIFFIFRRRLFPFWREKKAKRAKNVPYLFAILYRIARVSTTLHHHHHHPSPPFCATPLFLCFSLPSVAPRFGRGETRRRASSDRVPFFARMSLRDRMRLHVSPCLRRLINHTHSSCRSCAANAPNRNAFIAQPLALTTFTLLFATTARETETRKHVRKHTESALKTLFTFILRLGYTGGWKTV